MVDWLEPKQLVLTGLRAVIAETLGSYADRRELQAALAAPKGVDARYDAGPDGLWFDYVADLGDGFDSTYTIATLLGAESAEVDGRRLPRGRFVVLGGDQVYPTASLEEYRNRFVGPFRAAFPWSPADPPHEIFALPGNHDWYDGLTSFLRLFCQYRETDGRVRARWIGAWRTRQRHSYFAIALPGNWWLWAIDSQLESDLDPPQLEYFDAVGEEMLRQGAPGDQKVLLVTARPTWVYLGDPSAERRLSPVQRTAFNALAYFESRYIRAKGFRLPVVVSGDLHHYAHYERTQPPLTHRITSGGGGAFLLGTHKMPKRIVLPEGTFETSREQQPRFEYGRRMTYPDFDTSRRLARRLPRAILHSPRFSLLLAVVYALLGWRLATGHWGEWLLLAAAVVAALWSFTRTQRETQPRLRWPFGVAHGVSHVALAAVPSLVASVFVWYAPWARGWDQRIVVLAVILASFVMGAVGGDWLFRSYLLLAAERTGAHMGELFSAMAIADFKHFLRLHIDPSGGLSVFAVGIDRVPTDWKFRPLEPGECGRRWFTREKPLRLRLIEEIRVEPERT